MNGRSFNFIHFGSALMNITRGRLTSTLLATLLCQALPAQAAPAYLASVIPQPVITPDPTPTFRNAAGGVARMVAPDTIVKTPLPDITPPDYTRVQRFIQTGWQMDVTDATGVHAISNMGRSNGDIVGMADSGQVMGSVFDYVQHQGTPKDPKLGLPTNWGSFDRQRAFVYQNGVTTLIETPTGQDTRVHQMNRQGQALIQAESPMAQGWNGNYQAYYYNQGQLTDFGANTYGMAISQNGQALAQYQLRGDNGDVLEMEARVFDNGQVRGLGAGTFAHLMNDHGTVAGTAMVGDQFQTFIYRNGKTQVIAETAARGTIEKLTEHDQVVGRAIDPEVGRERTYIHQDGKTTFLHGLSTSPDDPAFMQDFFMVESVNKHGAVLGWGVGNPYHEIPMLYENGQYTLLAPLLAAAADAANVLRPDVFGLRLLDDGSIVGWTNSKLDGSLRYVSFAPVPEPGTWLLMSLGLWAVGLVRGHHTKRTRTQTLQA
jgi:PEP-CTERM motif